MNELLFRVTFSLNYNQQWIFNLLAILLTGNVCYFIIVKRHTRTSTLVTQAIFSLKKTKNWKVETRNLYISNM